MSTHVLRSNGVLRALLSVVAAIALPMFAPATNAAEAGRYQALESLPDFSGWWLPLEYYPNAPKIEVEDRYDWATPPPLKPKGLKTYRQIIDAYLQGGELDHFGFKPAAFCRPYHFNGLVQLDIESELEFLLTPGRITFTDEFGHLRRIYTDGRPLPAEPEESYTGTSVGRWEGQMLVVDTVGISREAGWFFGLAPLVGPGARSQERIFLREPDILQIETVVTAPASLTKPYRTVILLHRDRDHVAHELSWCSGYDRDVDESGRQRFDLTPPKDLPPPPSNK